MNHIARHLLDGACAALLIRPRGVSAVANSSHYVALIALYFFASLLVGWLDGGATQVFNAAGLLVILSDALLTLIATWLMVTVLQRPALFWDVACVTLAATIAVVVLLDWPLGYLLPWVGAHNRWLGLALEVLRTFWWLLVLLGITRLLRPSSRPRAITAAVLAFAISGAMWWFLPGESLYVTPPSAATVTTSNDGSNTLVDGLDGDGVEANADIDTTYLDVSPEQVMYEQPRLLGEALQKIKPREPGKTNLYVLSFAGDGSEDVFRNEAEYVEQLFSQRFDNAGRVLTLINNPSTLSTRPLATLSNLRMGLAGLAAKMDPAEDILLLFLTSHGSEDHQLFVNLEPLPLDQIDAAQLQSVLLTEPALRWKVLVVSACYSGGFVDALRDDSTMVITAARADRTSFGCGVDSDITWFGKAFFVDALNRTASIRQAFDLASADVRQWEKEAAIEEASEPQIASSHRIEAKLAEWERGRKLGVAVPFEYKRVEASSSAIH